MDPSLYSLVMNNRSAVKAWERLKKEYHGESVPKKLRNIKEAASVNFTGELTINTLKGKLSRAETIITNLLAADSKVDNIKYSHLVALLLIAALPPSLNNVRIILEKDLENCDNDSNKMDKLLSIESIGHRLLNEVETQLAQSGKVTASALQVTANCQHKRPKDTCWTCDPSKAPVCKPCKQKGFTSSHYQNGQYCQSKKNTPRPSQVEEKMAQLVINDSQDSKKAQLAVNWTMDSGSTDHSTDHLIVNKDALNFYITAPSNISAANGSIIHSPGMGKVAYETDKSKGFIENVLQFVVSK